MNYYRVECKKKVNVMDLCNFEITGLASQFDPQNWAKTKEYLVITRGG